MTIMGGDHHSHLHQRGHHNAPQTSFPSLPPPHAHLPPRPPQYQQLPNINNLQHQSFPQLQLQPQSPFSPQTLGLLTPNQMNQKMPSLNHNNWNGGGNPGGRGRGGGGGGYRGRPGGPIPGPGVGLGQARRGSSAPNPSPNHKMPNGGGYAGVAAGMEPPRGAGISAPQLAPQSGGSAMGRTGGVDMNTTNGWSGWGGTPTRAQLQAQNPIPVSQERMMSSGPPLGASTSFANIAASQGRGGNHGRVARGGAALESRGNGGRGSSGRGSMARGGGGRGWGGGGRGGQSNTNTNGSTDANPNNIPIPNRDHIHNHNPARNTEFNNGWNAPSSQPAKSSSSKVKPVDDGGWGTGTGKGTRTGTMDLGYGTGSGWGDDGEKNRNWNSEGWEDATTNKVPSGLIAPSSFSPEGSPRQTAPVALISIAEDQEEGAQRGRANDKKKRKEKIVDTEGGFQTVDRNRKKRQNRNKNKKKQIHTWGTSATTSPNLGGWSSVDEASAWGGGDNRWDHTNGSWGWGQGVDSNTSQESGPSPPRKDEMGRINGVLAEYDERKGIPKTLGEYLAQDPEKTKEQWWRQIEGVEAVDIKVSENGNEDGEEMYLIGGKKKNKKKKGSAIPGAWNAGCFLDDKPMDQPRDLDQALKGWEPEPSAPGEDEGWGDENAQEAHGWSDGGEDGSGWDVPNEDLRAGALKDWRLARHKSWIFNGGVFDEDGLDLPDTMEMMRNFFATGKRPPLIPSRLPKPPIIPPPLSNPNRDNYPPTPHSSDIALSSNLSARTKSDHGNGPNRGTGRRGGARGRGRKRGNNSKQAEGRQDHVWTPMGFQPEPIVQMVSEISTPPVQTSEKKPPAVTKGTNSGKAHHSKQPSKGINGGWGEIASFAAVTTKAGKEGVRQGKTQDGVGTGAGLVDGSPLIPNQRPGNASDGLKGVKLTDESILALDSEFVGTGRKGLVNILARVSIVDEKSRVIYDTFVRPDKNVQVTDFRTNLSGVRGGDLIGAPKASSVRKVITELIEDRIVVGHSLQSDFQVLRISHPNRLIRDTSLYFPLRVAFCDAENNRIRSPTTDKQDSPTNSGNPANTPKSNQFTTPPPKSLPRGSRERTPPNKTANANGVGVQIVSPSKCIDGDSDEENRKSNGKRIKLKDPNKTIPSLRGLAKLVLGRNIQGNEHNSIEDARAAMDVYLAYQEQWEGKMNAYGWDEK